MRGFVLTVIMPGSPEVRSALVSGAAIQILLWRTYYYVTGGCFCVITGVSNEPPGAKWLWWVVWATSRPGEWLSPAFGGWPAFILVNFFGWAALSYLAIKGLTLAGLRSRHVRPANQSLHPTTRAESGAP